MSNLIQPARKGLAALEWLNFFLADVQTCLGPFVAAYLAASGWNPGSVGYGLSAIAMLAFVVMVDRDSGHTLGHCPGRRIEGKRTQDLAA